MRMPFFLIFSVHGERIVFIHACQFKKILLEIWLLENMPIVISGNGKHIRQYGAVFNESPGKAPSLRIIQRA